jgi:hypothetical protein
MISTQTEISWKVNLIRVILVTRFFSEASLAADLVPDSDSCRGIKDTVANDSKKPSRLRALREQTKDEDLIILVLLKPVGAKFCSATYE